LDEADRRPARSALDRGRGRARPYRPFRDRRGAARHRRLLERRVSRAVPAPDLAPDRARPFVPLWGAVLLAAGAGPVTDAACPELGWWPRAFVGIAMVLVAAQGRRAASGFLVGFVFALSFYLVHIPWMTEFLGPSSPWIVRAVPWFALST